MSGGTKTLIFRTWRPNLWTTCSAEKFVHSRQSGRG